jgi:NAD-dependent deacetylase
VKKIVVLTGAGMSAESGLQTFRDSNGLWNNYSIYEVATPEAWRANTQLVLDFYNFRRQELRKAEPNAGHLALVDLESHFEVQIITQNVDNLHERAGSSTVVHLHGELTKARGEFSTDSIIDIGYENISLGQRNEFGEQLRPHIVWFGEDVPMIEKAADLCSEADILLVIGTSLQVYPAAGLVHITPEHAPIYLVDPNATEISTYRNVEVINEKAGTAVPALVEKLKSKSA